MRAACSLHATSSEALGSFSAASRLSASSADAGAAPGAAGAPGVDAGTRRGRRCGRGHGCGRPARVRRRAPGVGADAGGCARISTSRFRKNHDWYQRDAACGANCLQRRGRRIRRAAFPQFVGMQLLAFPRSRVCSRARFIPYCPLRGLTSIHFVKKEESQGAFSGARSLYLAKCKI